MIAVGYHPDLCPRKMVYFCNVSTFERDLIKSLRSPVYPVSLICFATVRTEEVAKLVKNSENQLLPKKKKIFDKGKKVGITGKS